MTSEEFFRNKIKEKNPIMDVVTLSTYLITAEEAMRWAYEFNELTKSEIPIIPEILDEEIEKYINSFPYTKHLDDGQYNDGVMAGVELGIEWYKEQLKHKLKLKCNTLYLILNIKQ